MMFALILHQQPQPLHFLTALLQLCRNPIFFVYGTTFFYATDALLATYVKSNENGE